MDAQDYISFFTKGLAIKKITRTGWMYKQVPDPESVADHTYGVILLAATIDLPEGIDRERLVKMAIVHDIGEGVIGDLVWENGKITHLDKQVLKHKKEKEALELVFKNMKSDELSHLSVEFLNQQTKAANFLKELDKLEMVFQALSYEQLVEPSKLDEFWDNADKYITTPQVRVLFDALRKQRPS